MERTKKIQTEEEKPVELTPAADGKIWWKKIGGGSLRLHGKMIKPEERFRAHPDDIPVSVRDIVVPLEELPEESAKPVTVAKSLFTMQPRGKSKTLFDVVDTNGKVLNEKPLAKAVAEKLISDLVS